MPKDGTEGGANTKMSGTMPSSLALPHRTGQAAQSDRIGIEPGMGPGPADAQISGTAAVAGMANAASTACTATA
jgi:hypothetical protein